MCVWSARALYVDMHMWSLVCMLFCVTFEHVFTVKAWHVQLHKEFIGFSVFFLTEISCSKLKFLCCVYRQRERDFGFFFFHLDLYLHRAMKICSIPKQAVKPGIIHTWDTCRKPSFLPHQAVSAPLVQIPRLGIHQMFWCLPPCRERPSFLSRPGELCVFLYFLFHSLSSVGGQPSISSKPTSQSGVRSEPDLQVALTAWPKAEVIGSALAETNPTIKYRHKLTFFSPPTNQSLFNWRVVPCH